MEYELVADRRNGQETGTSGRLHHPNSVDGGGTVAAHLPEEATVLDAHCPVHGTTVLLPTSRIRGLDSTDRGIVVVLECWDGARIEIVTGKAAQPV